MSLAAALTAGPTHTRKGPGCSVGLLLAQLPDSERAALLAMLADPDWNAEAIADRVSAEEDIHVTIQGQTIARHRRGRCSCGTR